MKRSRFLFGLVIGGLMGIVFWYWQKSTSAEDGAIDMLDRLAASEARVRALLAQLDAQRTDAPAAEAGPEPAGASGTPETDDLQEIAGIGPAYAARLQQAGIRSFAALAQQTPAAVVEVTAVRSEQTAASWIREAQERLAN